MRTITRLIQRDTREGFDGWLHGCSDYSLLGSSPSFRERPFYIFSLGRVRTLPTAMQYSFYCSCRS
jgi:hypothetical protein